MIFLMKVVLEGDRLRLQDPLKGNKFKHLSSVRACLEVKQLNFPRDNLWLSPR